MSCCKQYTHRWIVLAVACVVNESRIADSIIDNVLNFIESNTEGEIVEIEKELR